MANSLYEPINRYKPLAQNIGIVDGPFEYMTIAGLWIPLPFTTRMTVIRLRSGDLTLIPGGIFKEFVFFHKESKTLVVIFTGYPRHIST